MKLLRILEEKVIERVGDNSPILVDVRNISATNKNLRETVDGQLFRHDLFYRIHVIPIVLPPLRDREEDIPLLAELFLKWVRMKGNLEITGISTDVYLRVKLKKAFIDASQLLCPEIPIIHRSEGTVFLGEREMPNSL